MAEFFFFFSFFRPIPNYRRGRPCLQSAFRREQLSRVFKIYRFDPDVKENPRIDTYESRYGSLAARWCWTR